MKRIISLIFLGLLILSLSQQIFAQDQVELKFFFSDKCPHCSQAKVFLDKLEEYYPEIIVKRFNITDTQSILSLKQLYQEYEVPQEKWGLVPTIFTAKNYFIGFNDNTAQQIEQCAEDCLAGIHNNGSSVDERIGLPLIGKIDPSQYSLPALAIVLGFFDGFNVCSLGALVLILALVLALKEKKKILIFGGVFILTTAFIYGLLIAIWYQIFAFFAPYLKYMEACIGLLGIGGGIYFLKEFFRFRKQGLVCESSQKQGIIHKLSSKMQKALRQGGNVIILVFSVLLFAALAAIVEFPCSAAVPLFFAGVLAKSQLPSFHHIFYIALFILFYMLDEVIVFLIAFFTMTIKLASQKFVRYLTLAQSIILFLLGFYYLFN